MVINSWPACHEFDPSTAEDPQCRGRCTKNLLMLKRSPVGVVWKLGKGCQLRCRSCHLTMLKMTRSVSKSPRVAD
ncbi:hypothetical protein TNCV_591421 [Trichonephila clavipes]|nr:hypothetical protein TNCV_591421 [Trichonephila clavipes]